MAEGWTEGLAAVSEDARREAHRLGAQALEVLRTSRGCACPGDCEGGPECLDDEGAPLPDGAYWIES